MWNGFDNTALISTERSGLSLLQAIIYCSPESCLKRDDALCQIFEGKETYLEHNGIYSLSLKHAQIAKLETTLIDKLNAFKWVLPKTQFLWLVRNPLNVIKNKGSGIANWYLGNMCIYYFYASLEPRRRWLIRYEDMLMNSKKMSKTFDFLGLAFDKQFLHYGDFDQDFTLKDQKVITEKVDSHHKNNVITYFEKYKNSELCKFLGYNRNFD